MHKEHILNQFSKYSKKYSHNNVIQQIVSKALVRDISNRPQKILELGCGSGQVFKHISWSFKYYKAIDSSKEMCALHPEAKNLDVSCFDFDDEIFLKNIENEKYDAIISSSSLQWSKNLNKLLKTLSFSSNYLHAALFTSETFKSIHKISKQNSPILSLEKIKDSFLKHYDCTFEIFEYKLEFESKKEMFRYIKNSGVSGEKKLSFKTAKKLYKEYDLNYLEFEVVFIKAFSKS